MALSMYGQLDKSVACDVLLYLQTICSPQITYLGEKFFHIDDAFVALFDNTFFKEGIHIFAHCWDKCIHLDSNYVKILHNDGNLFITFYLYSNKYVGSVNALYLTFQTYHYYSFIT